MEYSSAGRSSVPLSVAKVPAVESNDAATWLSSRASRVRSSATPGGAEAGTTVAIIRLSTFGSPGGRDRAHASRIRVHPPALLQLLRPRGRAITRRPHRRAYQISRDRLGRELGPRRRRSGLPCTVSALGDPGSRLKFGVPALDQAEGFFPL